MWLFRATLARRDSNPRHPPCREGALPTELLAMTSSSFSRGLAAMLEDTAKAVVSNIA